MRRMRAVVLVTGMVCLAAMPAVAQEVVTGSGIIPGARALGMGGAQIAAASDVTAVIHNPAALARLDQLEVKLGVGLFRRTIKTNVSSATATGTGEYKDSAFRLGSFGIAYPVPTDRGSLVFALGYHRVKDFNGTFSLTGYDDEAFVTEDDMWGGEIGNETVEDGGVDVLSLAGAVDVSPNVSLGLSLDIWTGTYRLDKRIVRNSYTDQVSWLDLVGGEDDITAWSLKPSVLYFTDMLRAGAFLRLPMTYHIEQDNYEELYSTNDGYYFSLHERIDDFIIQNYEDSYDHWRASYKIKAPMQVGFGLALGTPNVRCVTFDMVYENWKEAEFEGEDDPYYFRDQYRDTLSWAVGGEIALPRLNSVLRAGYRHQPVSFKGPRDGFSPTIETVDERNYLTFGLTTQLDSSIDLNIGYAHAMFSQEEGARLDEETHNRIYAGITYRMPVYAGYNW